MASTLHVFRKYQKQFMAVLLLVAMFTFVVGTPLAAFLATPMFTGGAKDVAVSWKGGKLTEASLQNLRTNHHRLMNFLEAVAKKAQESRGQPKATPLRRASSEADIVLTLIKSQKAEQMGLVVTEDTMIKYLELLSDTSLKPEQMNSVLHESTGGQLSEQAMFIQLRKELLAQKLEDLTIGDLEGEYTRVWLKGEQPFGIPPSMAWNYFCRMNRRVSAEMVPFKATDYLAKVKGEPTEAQIKDLYEKHKDKYPNPNSPELGFKQPNRVAFQYVKIDYDKLLTAEKKKVTDQQIVDYYEKNKATAYTELDLPEAPGDKPEDKNTDDKKTNDEKGEDKKPEEGKPGDKKPEEKVPDEKKPDEKTPADKKSADPAPEPKDEQNPDGCGDELAEPEAKEDEPKEEETKPKPKKEDPATSDDPATDDPKKPAPGAPSSKEEPAKPKKKGIKYKPLTDKLKEEIRGQIALPLAESRRNALIKEVQDKVREYGRELRRWEAVSKLDTVEQEPKPEPLDVKVLARSLGIGWGEVPLVDRFNILEDAKREPSKYELSRIRVSAGRFGLLDFATIAFGVGAPLYEAQADFVFGRGSDGSEFRYVFWRTEEKPAYVPELKEVREKVIDGWKRKEAFTLAEQAARSLTEEVNKSHKSIKESLPDAEASRVFETDAFSWLSRNTPRGSPGQYGISRITKAGLQALDDAVETAGEDFMAAVFALQVGEAGVAVNHPQTEAYVVRILEEPLSEELLLDMFLALPNKSEIYELARSEHELRYYEWQQELEKELAIKWNRDPYSSDRM